jgi:hypothetical protein
MKTHQLLPFFILLLSVTMVAQPRFKQKKEQLKALKVAYITDELQLTPDEAASFWPVYNAFDEKQRELKQEKMRSYMDRFAGGEVDKMSDKEALNFLNQIESTEDQIYQLRKKFISSLKGVLSPIKIIKLKKAEEGFNKKLLEQFKENRLKN